jgi:LmbE family N-acetylglucosaminyl deacetylase
MKIRFTVAPALLAVFAFTLPIHSAFAEIPGVTMPPADGKLRIIAFGAHPDDCEAMAGGSAARWAEQGHHVLFVSVTNGDIGHWREAGGPLARRRKLEAAQSHQILGIQGVILDIHDGELEPTLENRRTLTRLIRKWKADLVLGPRTYDYHPDHRYTGILVQDAAFMVTVPFFCPDVPALRRNPVFMTYIDRFQKPNPSQADIVVAIDPVIEKKLDATVVMISQRAEGGAGGRPGLYPDDPAGQQQRQRDVRRYFDLRFQNSVVRFPEEVAKWYPGERAKNVKYAEAFEICEYGRQPDQAELKRLFPFYE